MKNGNQRSVDGIKNAYSTETRWGLRRAYVRALGRAGTQSAMGLLIELLNDEQDVRVMSTLTGQLGRYRDEAVVDALTAWLDREKSALRSIVPRSSPLDFSAVTASLSGSSLRLKTPAGGGGRGGPLG